MEIQIFGHKKDPDTRKALRFFAERRVKTHFVDFAERAAAPGELKGVAPKFGGAGLVGRGGDGGGGRAAAPGELKRFAQKFGVPVLIDREGKRFAERGLGVARYGDERWLELLVDDPRPVRTPPAPPPHTPPRPPAAP